MSTETYVTCLTSIEAAYHTASEAYKHALAAGDSDETQTRLNDERVKAQAAYLAAVAQTILNNSSEAKTTKETLDALIKEIKGDLGRITAVNGIISKISKMVALAAQLATLLA